MADNFTPGMTSNPQDPSDDDDFNVVGSEIFASSSPWASWLADGNPFAPTVIPSLSTEAGGTAALGDPSAFVPVTSGGITINLIFDAAALAAPASFRAGIQQAVAILAASITDKITVNLKIDYSGTGAGAAAGPDHGVFQSYSSIRADLVNNASAGDATFNALAAGTSIQGQSNVAVWNAQLKLWGLMAANDTTTDDGSATFATDINPNLLVGVALHELTHAMGRVPFGPQPDVFDLFRFSSAGTRLFQGGATAPAAFFSLDGGATKVADYGRTSDASDFLNSGVQGTSDPFNEFYNGATSQQLTAVDLKQLDALGFHLVGMGAGVNHAPLLIVPASTITVSANASLQASILFNAADADNDPLTYFFQDGTAAANSGHFVLNGTAIAQGAGFHVNAAQLAQLSFVAGTADDDLSMQVADDKGALSAAAAIHLHVNNHVPVLTVPASTVTANRGQVLQVSTLFSATDADGDTMNYFFQDGTSAANSGHFVLNGTAIAQGAEFHVTGAAQLAQLSFVAGSIDDSLAVQVGDDNGGLTAGVAFQVHVVNHVPVLTVPASTVTAHANQSLLVSSLFSAVDADGDTMNYFFQDGTAAAASGHFVLNGTAIAQGAEFHVTGAAQLAQLSFVAGSIDDSLAVQVGDDYGGLTPGVAFQVHVVNHVPVLTVPASTVTAHANQSLQVSSLFSATDADGDTMNYFFQDGTAAAASGHFVLNGTAIAQGAEFHVTGAAQLAQLSFVAGSIDDSLAVQVGDDYGGLTAGVAFQVHAVNHVPVLTVPASTVTANANQSLQVSSLFSATDADGDTMNYFFQDGTAAAASGHFVLNGTAIAQGAEFHVTGAAQLAQLSFVAGSIDDSLAVQVGDDYGGLTPGVAFQVHVGASGAAGSAAAFSAAASPDQFQFADSASNTPVPGAPSPGNLDTGLQPAHDANPPAGASAVAEFAAHLAAGAPVGAAIANAIIPDFGDTAALHELHPSAHLADYFMV
jgi:hypothetical protein